MKKSNEAFGTHLGSLFLRDVGELAPRPAMARERPSQRRFQTSTFTARATCAGTDARALGSPLHAITKRYKRGRRYCGPSAVCVVTGAEYGAVTRIIREKTGKRAVMGTNTYALAAAFQALGWRLVDRGPDEHGPRQTLARWARNRSPGDRSVYVINVTRHWVVVQGDEAADSKTGGPVPPAEFACLRKRVRRV